MRACCCGSLWGRQRFREGTTRTEVRADTEDEAIALVRDQLHTGTAIGAALCEVRVAQPRWDAAPVIPLAPIERAGEVGF